MRPPIHILPQKHIFFNKTQQFSICPYCGAKNKALNFYCSNCGKKLELVPEQK